MLREYNFMNKIKNVFYNDKTKIILLSTLIFMVIAHGFCYTNTLFSHDSIRTFFWTRNNTISIGRYLLPLLLLIRGKYYPPLLVGMLTYIFLSIIICICVYLFGLKKKTSIILVSGIFSTTSTLTLLNATYINFSDMYVFALLLVTIGAYLWRNYKYGFIIAIIPLFLSLPIYQPYICFFTGIVILLSLKDLFGEKRIKDIILGQRSILTAIIALISSMIIYAISLKLINICFHFELTNNYNSVKNIGAFSGINQIINLFIATYTHFGYYIIIHPNTYYYIQISIINIILIFLSLYICIKQLLKLKDKRTRLIVFITSILLIPFIINFVSFIGKGVEHQLMIYPFFLLYVFIIMLIEHYPLKPFNSLITIIILFTLFSNIIYSNQCYLIKDLNVKSTLITINRIIDRLEETEGYDAGKTKVTIIGTLNTGPLFVPRKEIDGKGIGMDYNYGLTYYETYKLFFDNYLAYPINIISKEEMLTLKNRKEVKDMPCFPNKNSIKFIDDTLIVKLSN